MSLNIIKIIKELVEQLQVIEKNETMPTYFFYLESLCNVYSKLENFFKIFDKLIPEKLRIWIIFDDHIFYDRVLDLAKKENNKKIEFFYLYDFKVEVINCRNMKYYFKFFNINNIILYLAKQ